MKPNFFGDVLLLIVDNNKFVIKESYCQMINYFKYYFLLDSFDFAIKLSIIFYNANNNEK